MSNVSHYLYNSLDRKIDGTCISELRDMWPGTLIAKGILHENDAKFVLDNDVDGIVVSNHGGRRFDAAPASCPNHQFD